MLFQGEKEAIQTVLALGAKYGYGNLIAHLRRAWALSLKSKFIGHTFSNDKILRGGSSTVRAEDS